MNTTSISIDELKRLTDKDIGEFSLEGVECPGKIVDIYDGDTCKVILMHDGKYMKFNCRLFGIDTPEMKPSASKPNREDEITAAKKCRNRFIQLGTNCNCSVDAIGTKTASMKQLLNDNTKIVKVSCGPFDKYGRLLVKIIDTETNDCVNEVLVKEGFARTYYGGTKEVY
jgi:endonuclease YncB( thermonuclease family)